MPLQILSREFGRMGRVYHDLSNGIDNSPLEPFLQMALHLERLFWVL
jgi:nucleotidyltransferase/DNA polymerase involved in DNA repair